jgi:hypothetical protein
MSYEMAEVYGAVTDRILINLAGYFPYVKPGEELPGAFEYQARMLAQMGQVNRETVDIIMKSLDGADAALRGALETAILDALKSEEPKLRKAAEQGLLGSNIPPEVAPGQMQAFKSYYAQSADKLNLVNTVMLESTQAAYTATVSDAVNRIQNTQAILNTGAGEVITGVSTWNTAMHDAVQKMVANGLTGFIDHGGHRWSPEAYVAMDIRTTMFNTSRAAINERAQEYGCDLYQVSSHNGARPLCYPWQGKVISRSGWTGTVEDLDGNKVTVHSESEIESFRYGGGLFGVNCGHYPMNFIPGVSTIKGEPQDEEENAKTYEESQQQRALERKLRAERRDLEVMKAQGADEEAIKAQRAKVRKASEDIDQFCDDTGRARRRNREYTPVNATWPDNYEPGKESTAERPKPRKTEKKKTEAKAESDFVLKTLPASNIEAVPVKRLGEKLTTQQIIDRVGGADKTSGSCSSLTLAYGGNKSGYDVLDFRGGNSQSLFSRYSSMTEIANFKGVDGIVVRDYNGFKSANAALASVEAGKEYYFATASHAAVVHKTETGLEYLELQSASNNGFHELNDNVLKWRFGSKRSRSTYGHKLQIPSILIDLEKLGQSPDFRAMLEYINTAADKQQKGAGGGIK